MLEKRLKKSLLKGILQFLPLAIGASAADGALLWGIRSFMDLINQESPFTLWEWLLIMVLLTLLRLLFFYLKIRQNDTWTYATSARLRSWYLRKLRNLSPRFFHAPESATQTEMAFDSIHTIQNNGAVFFQGTQAALQLLVFVPVLLYISWPLTLFLFVVIVPLVAWLQRKIHRMGPEEESLLFERSSFRNLFDTSRRLFRSWSAPRERTALSGELQKCSRELSQKTKDFSIRKNVLALVMESVSVFSMILVLAFCAVLISKGWMDGKGLVLFCSAVLLCYKPVKECSRALPQFRSLISACKTLFQFETLPEKSGTTDIQGEALSIRDGAFAYNSSASQTVVYNKLSLAWGCKKPVLLRGRNGAGKTTLLRLIAHLEEWDCGEITLPQKTKPEGVFLVPQDLELPPKRLLAKLLGNSADPAVNDFAEFANLQKLVAKESLSGGERAKVALLWALASSSKILLLDEPLAGIALADRMPILEKFMEACNRMDKWFLISSHDALPPDVEGRFLLVDLDHENPL